METIRKTLQLSCNKTASSNPCNTPLCTPGDWFGVGLSKLAQRVITIYRAHNNESFFIWPIFKENAIIYISAIINKNALENNRFLNKHQNSIIMRNTHSPPSLSGSTFASRNITTGLFDANGQSEKRIDVSINLTNDQ